MIRTIAPTEWRSQPWKNGLGITHEVWRSPDRADYDVRVSVADDTAPAPFSKFPGYHRWSILLEPAPIALVIDGLPHTLARVGDVVDHDGEAEVQSTALPAGATRLLNVLARPGHRVGIGQPSGPVRFAFAIADSPVLPRWHARVCETGAPIAAPVLWIA